MVERSFALANQAGASVTATSFDATDTIVARDAVDGLADIVNNYIEQRCQAHPDWTSMAMVLKTLWCCVIRTRMTLEQMSDSQFSVYTPGSGDTSSPILIQAGPGTQFSGNIDSWVKDFCQPEISMATASQISSLGGTMFSVNGALNSAGAVLVYFGQATSTGWSTVTNSGDWLPNITPSIAFMETRSMLN